MDHFYLCICMDLDVAQPLAGTEELLKGRVQSAFAHEAHDSKAHGQ